MAVTVVKPATFCERDHGVRFIRGSLRYSP